MTARNETHDLERYKLLHEMIHRENDRYWSKFNIFLILDALLINISFLISISPIFVNHTFVLCLLCIFGIILSLSWLLINTRARAYILCWIDDAKKIEDIYPALDIFTKGKECLKNKKWHKISAMTVGIIISVGFIVGFTIAIINLFLHILPL